MRIPKEITSKQRHQIILNNFLGELSKRKVTQNKYCTDVGIDITTISQWKKGNSVMNTTHVFQAANYFNITVNDLYYTTKEKKNIEVLSTSSYEPIKAQQLTNIKLLNKSFNNPSMYLIMSIFIFLLFTSLTLIIGNSDLSIIFMIFSFIFIYLNRRNMIGLNKTYVINYLDDIYYQRSSELNNSKCLMIFLHTLTMILSIICLLFFPKDLFTVGKKHNVLMVFNYAIIVIYLLLNIRVLINLPFNFKKEINDFEIYEYTNSFWLVSFAYLLLSLNIMTILMTKENILLSIALTIVIAILNSFEFIIISKEFNKYKLVYEEEGQKPRKLEAT